LTRFWGREKRVGETTKTIHEGDTVDEAAWQDLIRSVVEFTSRSRSLGERAASRLASFLAGLGHISSYR
jgi:hypothetical protein